MKTFKMKDLGTIHWFLGLEIICDRAWHLISINQTQYITNVISHFNFINSHPISTPIPANFKLPWLDTPEINACQYQSHIGSIMYTMLGTHPDIVYVVGILSQFSANPGKRHLEAINHVLRYLNATKDYKIIYDGNSYEDEFTAHCDSDWASDSCNHWSISGYVFKIAGAAIAWSSKKQSSTALLSTKGEYMALTHTTKEAIWIREFLGDVLFPPSIPMTLLGNNQGTLALVINPAFHAQMKHIWVCQHFIRECVNDNDVDLEYVLTADQVANVLTKGLSTTKHKKFTKEMGLFGVSAHWVGMLDINGA